MIEHLSNKHYKQQQLYLKNSENSVQNTCAPQLTNVYYLYYCWEGQDTLKIEKKKRKMKMNLS